MASKSESSILFVCLFADHHSDHHLLLQYTEIFRLIRIYNKQPSTWPQRRRSVSGCQLSRQKSAPPAFILFPRLASLYHNWNKSYIVSSVEIVTHKLVTTLKIYQQNRFLWWECHYSLQIPEALPLMGDYRRKLHSSMQFSAYSKEEKNSKHFQLLTSCPLDCPMRWLLDLLYPWFPGQRRRKKYPPAHNKGIYPDLKSIK